MNTLHMLFKCVIEEIILFELLAAISLSVYVEPLIRPFSFNL